jgi:hypothetical protein
MSDSLTSKYIEVQNVEQTFKTAKGRLSRCATST